MSQKKLLFGLPVALLLGGSAIAFGVLPGVRDWVDQTVPWLGINGGNVSTALNQLNQSHLKPVVEDNSSPKTLIAQFDNATLGSLPVAPQYEVQTAVATRPIPTNGQNQAVGEMPPTIAAVPPAGIPVPSSANGTIVVNLAVVYFPDDSTVAAQADGIIVKMFVDDGNMVKTDSPLLDIDARTAAAEVEMAMKEMEAADLKAKNESNLEYSKKALEVAKKEFEISEKLLLRGAEDLSVFEKKQLEREKAFFQVNMSETDRATNAAEHIVKKAKYAATQIQMELRKILAQRTGMVTEITKRQGDWVRAGEPILRLTSLDRIRIKGIAEVYDAPHLLLNAPARVSINFAPGKSESIDGTVTFVSPRATAAGKYQIYVDLPNRLTPDGQYLFREGMTATIEVAPRTR
jgi:multidrug efflux pump subunit AcrA (membrane-fusion protein)